MTSRGVLLRAACLGIVAGALGAGETRAVTSSAVVGGLASPTDIVNAGDHSGRLFIVEQPGTIRIVAADRLVATPFLDIRSLVLSGGEQGFLGLAFHPQFAANRRFFIDYTRQSDGATVIAEYRASATDPNQADAASARILLTIAQPFANHNGGALRFGPDGFLYIGMGDGGSANDPGNRAQDTQELLGKILRIDVDRGAPYAIPAANPYATAGGRKEIWAIGVRNPWRFNFDRATGDFFIGDVGQDKFEEIDWRAAGTGAGTNFGWRIMEADNCTGFTGPVTCLDPSLTLPILQYGHDLGCSVTGGTVYRGRAVPALAGRYVYGDFCSGRLWSAARNALGGFSARDIATTAFNITTFGEDESGELYFSDFSRGEVRRFVAEATDRVDVVEYYNAALDHYFITATPAEINALDGGTIKGWARTGLSFPARSVAQSGARELCRFYIPPAQGDSHFFSASPDECRAVAARFPTFIVEGPTAIFMVLPDATSGACPGGLIPVYRIWNARVDSNHRYTSDAAVRNRMVAQGGIAEGYGPSAVALCAIP